MKILPFILLLVLPSFGQSANCLPTPPGLVGWWRAEGDAMDSADGDHGTLLGGTSFATGEVAQAFSIDASGGGVDLGSPTNLYLQDLTIEAWIRRGSSTRATWDIYNHGQIVAWAWGGGYGIGMFDDGHCFFEKVGYTLVSSSFTLTDTSSFHHLAVTKTGSNVVLYLDGVGETIAPYDPGFVFNGTFCIGTRGSDHVTSFRGLVDEVSVYSRGLMASEIEAIYAAGRAGKCGGPIAPFIVSHPQGRTAYWGRNTTFSVTATGTEPLWYLWRKDGTAIPWATNSTLTLTNLSLSDGGNYSAIVSNVAGFVTSSNALLVINPAGVSLGLYPGLTIEGTPGNTYGIQYATNVSPDSTWIPLSQITLSQPVQLWIDTGHNVALGTTPRRFYRVVALP